MGLRVGVAGRILGVALVVRWNNEVFNVEVSCAAVVLVMLRVRELVRNEKSISLDSKKVLPWIRVLHSNKIV